MLTLRHLFAPPVLVYAALQWGLGSGAAANDTAAGAIPVGDGLIVHGDMRRIRDDLAPLEEAGALLRLLDEFGLTHQQVAEAVGKSRTTVTNLLRLLELEAEVKSMLDQGRLEMGHARALLGLKGVAQTLAGRQVVARGLSVRETEKLVRRLQTEGVDPGQSVKPPPDPDIRRLQDDLTERLGARVAIQHGNKGTGKLVIAYNSLDELDGILAHIN